MDQLVSRLLLYGDLGKDSILVKLEETFQEWKGSAAPRQTLVRRIYDQVKRLLDLATDYGFDENLWQNYLTFLLMTNENSFSLITERVGELEGTVNHFAKSDFGVFRALFHYDFGPIEADLGIDCFTTLCNYTSIYKHERRYNKNVSEKVRDLSRRLAAAQDDETFFQLVTGHYRQYGVGLIGLNKAFRIRSGPEGVSLIPIYNTDKVMLRDLVGYESQKEQLRGNTEAFLAGRSTNNVLLYGDAGTGKSSSVKALINEYYDQGLRMIEIYKHQFRDLSAVIAMVKNRNYRFIIFIDDLSFEENEVEYKFLKAVIEGGVETKPDNIHLQPPQPHPGDLEGPGGHGARERRAPLGHLGGKALPVRPLRGAHQLLHPQPKPVQGDRPLPGPAPGAGRSRGRAAGGGQQMGAAPRRGLRPHGPAVHQLHGGHPAQPGGINHGDRERGPPDPGRLSGDPRGPALCLLLPHRGGGLLAGGQRGGRL